MPQILLVANWKQNGSRKEALAWIKTFTQERDLLAQGLQIVVCPPLKTLDLMAQNIEDTHLPIATGVQSIPLKIFEGEKNTGANSPTLLADSATYAIVGHSETRKNCNLTDDDVAKKAQLAKKYNLTPIVCISEIKQVETLKKLLPDYANVIAYEPLFAIGSGNPDSPENANKMAQDIKKLFPSVSVIYGGSVDGSNIKSFLSQSDITGVLVGHRSASATFFLEIVRQACFLAG